MNQYNGNWMPIGEDPIIRDCEGSREKYTPLCALMHVPENNTYVSFLFHKNQWYKFQNDLPVAFVDEEIVGKSNYFIFKNTNEELSE